MITSRRNPLIQSLRSLTASARERVEAGLLVVEGSRCLNTALAFGAEPTALLTAAEPRDPDALRSLVAACAERWPSCEITEVDREVLAWAVSVQSQVDAVGIVRRAEHPLPTLTGQVHRALILEDLGDPGNVGSCIRSAAAAGADCVVLAGHCADWSNPKTVRGSAGTVFALPVTSAAGVAEALAALDLPGIGTDAAGTVLIHQAGPRERFALVLGSEVRGLSEGAVAACQELLAIPMARGVESLNVSAAAAVCLFQLCRP